jgi:hypothetical protein
MSSSSGVGRGNNPNSHRNKLPTGVVSREIGLLPEQWDVAKKIGGGNYSKGVRRLIQDILSMHPDTGEIALLALRYCMGTYTPSLMAIKWVKENWIIFNSNDQCSIKKDVNEFVASVASASNDATIDCTQTWIDFNDWLDEQECNCLMSDV